MPTSPWSWALQYSTCPYLRAFRGPFPLSGTLVLAALPSLSSKAFSDSLCKVNCSLLFPITLSFLLWLVLLECRRDFSFDSLEPAQGQAHCRCSINIYE